MIHVLHHSVDNIDHNEEVDVIFFSNGVKHGKEKLWVDRSRTVDWPSVWLPANLYVLSFIISNT